MSGLLDIIKAAAQANAAPRGLLDASATVPPDFYANKFNTALTPEQLQQYQAWGEQQSTARGWNPAQDTADYDMQGYWLKNAATGKDSGHFPDTYKKPNHPTFSDQSQYSGTPSPWGVPYQGGTWAEDGSSYTPSATMLKYTHSLSQLQKYMKQVEPNSLLNMDRR